jgi:hypothetical protein
MCRYCLLAYRFGAESSMHMCLMNPLWDLCILKEFCRPHIVYSSSKCRSPPVRRNPEQLRVVHGDARLANNPI